jgi:DNA-binding response OmpR family regulator
VTQAAGGRFAEALDSTEMTKILLLGRDEALLEGLVQALSAAGHAPSVAHSLADAREIAAREQPLVAIVDRLFAAASASELLSVPLAPGGALVLFRTAGSLALALPPVLVRSVLADLTLPLERNRLVALVQSVEDRARASGRTARSPLPPEAPRPA